MVLFYLLKRLESIADLHTLAEPHKESKLFKTNLFYFNIKIIQLRIIIVFETWKLNGVVELEEKFA